MISHQVATWSVRFDGEEAEVLRQVHSGVPAAQEDEVGEGPGEGVI